MLLQNKKVLTFILAGGKGSRLYPLTRDRSKPAVFFAARFRIIDFVLSSCINSGLRRVFILTQTKSLSLHQHLRESWSFLPNELSEFVATVPAQQRISEEWYSGTADAIYQNLNLLEDLRPEHVFILSGDHIYNMDFNELYHQHIDRGADLTASVLEIKKDEAAPFGVLTMDEELNINSFIEKPQDPSLIPGESDTCFINMGIYLFRTDSLVRMLAQDARKMTAHDFGQNIIPDMVEEKYQVNGFSFKNSRFGHYWQDVGTIRSYYNANMDFLSQLGNRIVCTPEWPIKTSGAPSAVSYFGGNEGVSIKNSTVGLGAHLSNCRIHNSLIGREVTIGNNTLVEDSIIMTNSSIGRNCTIRNAIFDKHVVIPDNVQIGCDPQKDQEHFFVSDGIVVLPKDFLL
ncbi:MAG: glucose-1-phosphate adenylyltransferase [SAR324 cluster bacterium]|nr:glucose-1-phosphate adenylyltransferase [SAR324 cluster bacterium]